MRTIIDRYLSMSIERLMLCCLLLMVDLNDCELA
jgi:hypothetical protein